MQQIFLILYFVICVSLIALILIQNSKGSDITSALSGGASQTVFGSQGASSFLFKLTSTLGALFFIFSLILSYLAIHSTKNNASSILPTNSIQVIPSQSTSNTVQGDDSAKQSNTSMKK